MKLTDLVFNTHYQPDSVRRAAMHIVDPAIRLHFTHEPVILGSGGGIAGARTYLQSGETFAVANGDGVILCEDDDTLERMLDFHESRQALATLLVCPLVGVGTRIPGVWMDPYGEVGNFGKAPSKPHLQCFHYASIMLLSDRIWKDLPDGNSNILYDILEPRIAEGEKLYGYRVDNMRWFETGNATDYLAATQTCMEWMAQDGNRLGECACHIIERHGPPSTLTGAARHLIADSAQISPSAQLSGFSVIGADARIGAYARLKNSVVLPSAAVADSEIRKNEVII